MNGQKRSAVASREDQAPGSATPRKILLCYDGSDEADRALERVAELAAAAPSAVTIVSVADPVHRTGPFAGYAAPSEEEAHRSLLEQARGLLAVFGIEAATLEPAGDATDAVVTAARDTCADLVVVGSRHRGAIRRLLFGSVSSEVVVEAPCDVLVVR